MFEAGAGQNTNVYEDAGSLVELQQISSNRQYRHHLGLPSTKMMLAPEPPGLPPLEAIYMDQHLTFYEQDHGGKQSAMAYCNLEPIGLEHDQMPPGTPHDLQPHQRQFTIFEDFTDISEKQFQTKPPLLWESGDVIEFLINWAAEQRVDLLDINTLNYSTLTGQDLCRMSRSDFLSLDNHFGHSIYETLQYLQAQYGSSLGSPDMNHTQQTQTMLPIEMVEDDYNNRDRSGYNNVYVLDAQEGPSPASAYSGCESDRESASSLSTVNERSDLLLYAHQATKDMAKPTPNSFIKRVGRRGRPPKKEGKLRSKQGKGNGKLWEFIRDLLLDPQTCPSMIRWERREDGIFKFVQSDKVAHLWGNRKQNPRMNYEKLSRAMRYYYKSQVLLPVFGRRLVYKFGPNATGWRPTLHQSQAM